MTAQIIHLHRRGSRPRNIDPISLDLLEARLRAGASGRLLNAASQSLLLRMARDALSAEGVVLKGHKSAIEALLQCKVDAIRSALSLSDDRIDILMQAKRNGRPNSYSPLRDLLIYSYCHMVFEFSKVRRPVSIREARKQTAKFFNLTSDTRVKRSSNWSIERVQRAGERTLAKFAALDRHVGIASTLPQAWQNSVCAIGLYIAETEGGASAEMQADMAKGVAQLLAVCRLLAFAAHRERALRTRRKSLG